MRAALGSRTIRVFLLTQVLLEVQFWFPVYLIYLLDLGFPLTTAVLADAVFRLVAVACEFPVGVVADRIGRRRTYLALAGGSVLTFAAITQIGSLASLFCAWILWGVVWALASGAANTYLYELCLQDEREISPSRAFGLARVAGNLAVLASLLAAGYLYEVDPRLPFAATAALSGVALLLALTLPEITGPRVAATFSSVMAELRAAAYRRGLRRAVWLGALLLLFGWSARILFQPLALELGMSTRATGWMYATFAAASVLGGLAAGYVGMAHRRTALAVAFVLILAALVATSQMAGLGPFLFLPALGLGHTLGTTVLDIFTNEVTPQPVRATVFGLVACLGGLGIAVARPGLGVLADNYSVPFAFGAWALAGVVLLALAAPGILRMRAALNESGG